MRVGVHFCRRSIILAVMLELVSLSAHCKAGTIQKNQKPIANAGSDQRAGLGQQVALSASESYDPEGEALTYHWSQVKGMKMDLVAANTIRPSFVTPLRLKNDKSVELVFKLTVSDSRKNRSTDKVAITLASQPCEEPAQLQNGSCVTPVARLNDTGVTLCDPALGNNASAPCPVYGYPGQDAESGRDHTHNDDSNGHAGFSFTKIGSKGEILAKSTKHWDCVKDNVTGLIWEVKTADRKLRDFRNTYSWYLPDNNQNGGNAGTQNAGQCKGSNCDTNAYQQAVNAQGLCGASDWRLPTVTELMSIVDYSVLDPAIGKEYFPHTARLTDDLAKVPDSWYRYWTSFPMADDPSYAVMIQFDGGGAFGSLKNNSNRIRLVRGGQ